MKTLIKLAVAGPVTLMLFAQSISAQVLAVGESWSAVEEYTFNENTSGLYIEDSTPTSTGTANTGSNASAPNFNTNNKLTTDGLGSGILVGDSTTFTRKVPDDALANGAAGDVYAVPYSTGKWRLEINFSSYNFDGYDVGSAEGVDAFAIKVLDNAATNKNVGVLNFRLKDDGDADTLANTTSVGILSDYGLNKYSGAKDLNTATSTNGAWTSLAIEFDFDNDEVFYYRNGTIIAGTGIAGNDTGAFLANQFDQLLFNTSGTGWGTAGTFLAIDSMGLYTATVPESKTVALIMGLSVLGIVLYRRRQ